MRCNSHIVNVAAVKEKKIVHACIRTLLTEAVDDRHDKERN